MFRWLGRAARAVVRDTRGQATVEYALVLFVTVALLVGISTIVLNGLSAYYRDITSLVCLPIP